MTQEDPTVEVTVPTFCRRPSRLIPTPGHYLCSTDDPDVWLVIAVTDSGGFHCVYDADKGTMSRLRDRLVGQDTPVLSLGHV